MELLLDRSLPIPEIFGSKPIFGKFYFLSTVQKWYENKEKEAGNGSIFINIRIDICLQCLRHIGIVFLQVFDSKTVEYFINSFFWIVVFYLLRTKEKMGRRNHMKNGKIKSSYLVKVHFQQFSSTHI